MTDFDLTVGSGVIGKAGYNGVDLLIGRGLYDWIDFAGYLLRMGTG